MRVHLISDPGAEALTQLHQRLDDRLDVTVGELCGDAEQVDVLVHGTPTAEQLDASPKLSHVVIPYAGVPGRTRTLLLERPGIHAHNLHHNAASTAEGALALLFAAAKRVIPLDGAMRRHDWSNRGRAYPSHLLSGGTALVLGYGAIGRRVARVLVALGMTVLATRRELERGSAEENVELHPPGALRELLPRAAAVVVCLPLTDETTGLLGATELALLPPDAIVVNIGRGPILDETALYEALRDGRLGAAGIDVWYRYPRAPAEMVGTEPSAHPFHELRNVVMTPHTMGAFAGNELERMRHLATLLNAIVRDEHPPRVDLGSGY